MTPLSKEGNLGIQMFNYGLIRLNKIARELTKVAWWTGDDPFESSAMTNHPLVTDRRNLFIPWRTSWGDEFLNLEKKICRFGSQNPVIEDKHLSPLGKGFSWPKRVNYFRRFPSKDIWQFALSFHIFNSSIIFNIPLIIYPHLAAHCYHQNPYHNNGRTETEMSVLYPSFNKSRMACKMR